jgi:uncharacterized membrane protein YagU involved in acid resistance
MEDVADRARATTRFVPDVVGLAGAVAGFMAGLVMVALSPILSALNGISIWEPPRLIASTVMGSAALSGTGFEFAPVAVGFVLHMITSTVLGAIFGIVMNRVLHLTTDFGMPLYVGLCYGLIIFFVAYFVILPLTGSAVDDNYVGAVIAQNIVFGLCLGLFYTLLRPRPYRDTANGD